MDEEDCEDVKVIKMKIKTCLFSGWILLAISNYCYGQNVSTFNKTYDKDSILDLLGSNSLLENDSGYLFAAHHTSPSLPIYQLYLVQTNFNGDTLWTQIYGQAGIDQFGIVRGLYHIKNSTDYTFGVSYHEISNPIFLVEALIGRMNNICDTLWTNKIHTSNLITYPSVFYYSSLGEYISCGLSRDSLANGQSGLPDGFFIKADTSGNFISTKKYQNPGSDWLWGIAETPDHGFLLAGNTNSSNISHGGYDFWVIRTDSIGDTLWQQCYGGTNDEWGQGIIALNDSNYLLYGEKYKGRIYKIDINGNVIWLHNYNTTIPNVYESIYDAIELPNGDIVTAGISTNTPTGNEGGWVMRLNSTGYKTWERYFSWDTIQGSIDGLYNVIATKDGGFLFGGYANIAGKTQDAWLWKLDENGCDSTGCATVFTGIEEQEYEENEENTIAFPNPFKGNSITLLLPVMPQDGKIEVTFFNQLGQQALTTTAFATHPAHVVIYDNALLDLRAGLYFVQLKTKRGIYSAKVLKQ